MRQRTEGEGGARRSHYLHGQVQEGNQEVIGRMQKHLSPRERCELKMEKEPESLRKRVRIKSKEMKGG